MNFLFTFEEIDNAAQSVLRDLGLPAVVAFEGEMGAGKTTFIHALCRSLGATGSFGSPTFSIINEYSLESGPLYHIDLYRCRDEDEAIRAGVEDCLFSGCTCFVEWPSRAPGIFPAETVRAFLSVEEEGARRLSIASE